MRVRLATPADAEAIRVIYNAEISGDVNTFDLVPRTVADQREWMERHSGAHPVVVAVAEGDGAGQAGQAGRAEPAVEPGTVIGFGSLSPFRNRPAYSTTVEDSVYVDADQRGQGAGRALLEELIRLAGEHGFHAMIARIVGGNEPSIALHRACGFELVGIEREVGRKHRKWLDVVELQRLL